MANNKLIFFEHQPSSMIEQWMGDDSMKISKHFSVIDDYLYYDGENTGVYLKGSTGDTGKSAFELAQENGVTDTNSFEEWYATLKGEKGDTGSPMIVKNIVVTSIPPKGNNNDYNYVKFKSIDAQGNLYDENGNIIPGYSYTMGTVEPIDPTDPNEGYNMFLKVRQGNPGVVGPNWNMTQVELQDAQDAREAAAEDEDNDNTDSSSTTDPSEDTSSSTEEASSDDTSTSEEEIDIVNEEVNNLSTD